MGGRRSILKDYAWISIPVVFLIPVLLLSGHHDTLAGMVEQGPLLFGRAALDSILETSGGRPVIVNFWATWCTPCVMELPHLDELFREKEGGVAVVAVDLGDPSLEALLGFREGMNLAIPVVWLDEEQASSLKKDLALPDVLPVTLIFDEGGEEMTRVAGARSKGFFMQAVDGSAGGIEDDGESGESPELHVNVVGNQSDSITIRLLETAVELAGEENVDFYDPGTVSDSLAMVELHLPFTGAPYAQPCVGSACGRPAGNSGELLEVVDGLLD